MSIIQGLVIFLYVSNNYLKESRFHSVKQNVYFTYLNNYNNMSNIVPMMKKKSQNLSEGHTSLGSLQNG